MDDLCDSLVAEILSHVAAADQWLLRFVCRRFRSVVAATTAAAADPRRRRILDDALERAISGGGLATVRVLIGRPSCVWVNAVRVAAARGDLEMVRFIATNNREYDDDDDDDYAHACICAALTGGHVAVAEFLWGRTRVTASRYRFEDLLVASAKSASRSALAWTVSKNPAVASRVLKEWPVRILVTACIAGDVTSVEYVCAAMAPAVYAREMERYVVRFASNVAVLRFLHDRSGYMPSPKSVAMMENNHGALAYLLETSDAPDGVLRELLGVPAHATPDFHAYLRSKGHRVDIDLAAAALHVARCGSIKQMETLMELRPDPAEWIAELGPATLSMVLEAHRLQASVASFFRDHRRLDFEITDSKATSFAALRAMGGRCGCRTFSRAVSCADVDHARAVWAAMDDAARRAFRSRADQGIVDWAHDIDMLTFAMAELGIPGHRISMLRPIPRRAFTLELARFVLAHAIETPLSVLDQALKCGHLDVVEHVAPACTRGDLVRCLRLRHLYAAIGVRRLVRSVLARTHPMLRWIVRFILQ